MINGENYTLDILETFSEAEEILYKQFAVWKRNKVDYSIYAVQKAGSIVILDILCVSWDNFETIVNSYLNENYRVYTTGGVYITNDENVMLKEWK